jgi:ATP-binding cassette subfamily B protein
VRYDRAATPALRDLTLRLRAGQRVLLQGPSGSGKSTLASSLTGLLPIESGQILLGGLDMSALGGRKWRSLVATAPQFHENHLFSQPLAFNLLMGRAWPPSPEDLREAQQICEELGLGPLLLRMPSGLFTHVGETGWQLSHGERSRIFIARTLLQRAQVVLLDESFAALDPETLATTLRCVLRRVPTLFVIAHP